MARMVENVSEAVTGAVDNVKGKMRARRRRQMLAERWPLLVVLSLAVVGIVAGVAFAITRRGRFDEMDMNSQLDDLLGAGTTDSPSI